MKNDATGRNDPPIYAATVKYVPFDVEAIRNRPRWDIAVAESAKAGRGTPEAGSPAASKQNPAKPGQEGPGPHAPTP